MYGLETIHAMNAQIPGDLAEKRVKAVRRFVDLMLTAHKSPNETCKSAYVLRRIKQMLRMKNPLEEPKRFPSPE